MKKTMMDWSKTSRLDEVAVSTSLSNKLEIAANHLSKGLASLIAAVKLAEEMNIKELPKNGDVPFNDTEYYFHENVMKNIQKLINEAKKIDKIMG